MLLLFNLTLYWFLDESYLLGAIGCIGMICLGALYWRIIRPEKENRENTYYNSGTTDSRNNEDEEFYQFLMQQEMIQNNMHDSHYDSCSYTNRYNDDCQKNWDGEQDLYDEYRHEYHSIDEFLADHDRD